MNTCYLALQLLNSRFSVSLVTSNMNIIQEFSYALNVVVQYWLVVVCCCGAILNQRLIAGTLLSDFRCFARVAVVVIFGLAGHLLGYDFQCGLLLAS